MLEDNCTYNGLFGLRLTNSLHLGHIIGNINPAISDQNNKTIIVVLADLFTYTSERKQDITLDNILSMTSESFALGLNNDNVKFVIQSKAFPNLIQLFSVLSCLIKFEKLKKTKPISSHFEKGAELKFSDLTFPLVQCAEMLSTNSDILYSNIDNLGIVTLTKDLYKKVGNYSQSTLPKPKLVSGILPNVIGIDYKKMSQSRNNAIYLDDSLTEIKRKITSIDTSYPDKEKLNLQLIFQYFKIIGYKDSEIKDLENSIVSNKSTPLKLKTLLSDELYRYLNNISEKKKDYMSNQNKIKERIENDTNNVSELVTKNIENIFSNIYSKDFYKQFNI